jgi:hypothetical protein
MKEFFKKKVVEKVKTKIRSGGLGHSESRALSPAPSLAPSATLDRPASISVAPGLPLCLSTPVT